VRGFVLDKIDTALGESVRALNVQTLIANTIMRTSDDRKQLAMEAINFIGATV
jgi:hypothetical protein